MAWPSPFTPGGTFALYVARLEIECALIGLDFKWLAKAVSLVLHGLSKAGEMPFSPKPALTDHQLTRIAARKGLQGEPALIALLSWTFLLRVQAECLPPRDREQESIFCPTKDCREKQ